MAIRLRNIKGNTWIALCAARSKAKEGDLYLDDGQHGALTDKFLVDLCHENYDRKTEQLIKQEEDPEAVAWQEKEYEL